MIKRLTRESVDAVRKRTLLATAASAAGLASAPTAYASQSAQTRSVQHQTAATAAARAALYQAEAGRMYAPAPPRYSIVYDNGAGYNPGSTDAQSIGQYADTNTNTVHTTRGFSKRQIAQDVGQIFGYSVLTPGDRSYFSRLLGTDPAYWTDLHSNSRAGVSKEAGDEAFANYYALAATGGLEEGESLLWGNTSIRPDRLRKFAAALKRLGKRKNLPRYQ